MKKAEECVTSEKNSKKVEVDYIRKGNVIHDGRGK